MCWLGRTLPMENGVILLLAYRCNDGIGGCPEATSGADQVTYAVDRRPLFQVLVQYDVDLLGISGVCDLQGRRLLDDVRDRAF